MKTTNLTKQEAIEAIKSRIIVFNEDYKNGILLSKSDTEFAGPKGLLIVDEKNSVVYEHLLPETGFSIYQPEAKHTPLPWPKIQTVGPYQIQDTYNIEIWNDYDYGIRHVASAKGLTKEICEANAALIIKAVNNHDRLIEALKRCTNLLNDIDSTLFHHNHGVDGWHKNGDIEPMMNFVAEMDIEAISFAETTLKELEQ